MSHLSSIEGAGDQEDKAPIDPIEVGAEAAHSLSGGPKPNLLERLVHKLGHPEGRPIIIGGHLKPRDGPPEEAQKLATKSERKLTAEEQAIVDSVNPETDPFVLP